MKRGDDLDAVLDETQEFFEQLADHSESIACTFIAHLWPIAGARIEMHDLCDSIMLWLTNHHQPEISTHLRHIAANADLESVRLRFRQLVDGNFL